jgi:hypothetical protein
LLGELCIIPKEAFREYFQNWRKCREQCTKSGGEYFEGDKDQELQIKWADDLLKLLRILMDRPHTYSTYILNMSICVLVVWSYIM